MLSKWKDDVEMKQYVIFFFLIFLIFFRNIFSTYLYLNVYSLA